MLFAGLGGQTGNGSSSLGRAMCDHILLNCAPHLRPYRHSPRNHRHPHRIILERPLAHFSRSRLYPQPIGDLIEAVDRAEHAATEKKGTRLPRGRSALTSPQFSLFVHQLYFAALTFGGSLTCNRSGKVPIAKGSFVNALDALRALPAWRLHPKLATCTAGHFRKSPERIS